MKTLHSEAQIVVASTSQTDSILVINGKKAVATKNLILGFGTNETAFSKMWKRNESDFLEDKDWNWYNSYTGQIVKYRNAPKVTRIFWTTGVSKASTKFNSVKAKEFAQKMFDKNIKLFYNTNIHQKSNSSGREYWLNNRKLLTFYCQIYLYLCPLLSTSSRGFRYV